jgi:hypothetical protein
MVWVGGAYGVWDNSWSCPGLRPDWLSATLKLLSVYSSAPIRAFYGFGTILHFNRFELLDARTCNVLGIKQVLLRRHRSSPYEASASKHGCYPHGR